MDFRFTSQDCCQVCGSELKKPFAKISSKNFPEFTYVVCADCGLAYMDPVPDRRSYALFYANYFWDLKTGRLVDLKGKENPVADDWMEGRRKRVQYLRQTRHDKIESYLSEALGGIDQRSRLLEIGCAWGGTLSYLHEKYGVAVSGIEPSAMAVSYLKEHHPVVSIIGRSIEDLYNESTYDASFDAIILSHCLENITDQNAALNTVRRLLSDTGVLYIDTPNLYWHEALNPFHPFVYQPQSLRRMSEKHGFAVRRMDFCSNPSQSIFNTALVYLRGYYPYITTVLQKNHSNERGYAHHSVDAPEEVITRWRNGMWVVRRASYVGRMYDKILSRFPTVLRERIMFKKLPPKIE